jgi:hypothetical protein
VNRAVNEGADCEQHLFSRVGSQQWFGCGNTEAKQGPWFICHQHYALPFRISACENMRATVDGIADHDMSTRAGHVPTPDVTDHISALPVPEAQQLTFGWVPNQDQIASRSNGPAETEVLTEGLHVSKWNGELVPQLPLVPSNRVVSPLIHESHVWRTDNDDPCICIDVTTGTKRIHVRKNIVI